MRSALWKVTLREMLEVFKFKSLKLSSSDEHFDNVGNRNFSTEIYIPDFYLTFFNVDIYNSFINKITNLNRLNIKMKKRKKKKEKKKKQSKEKSPQQWTLIFILNILNF